MGVFPLLLCITTQTIGQFRGIHDATDDVHIAFTQHYDWYHLREWDMLAPTADDTPPGELKYWAPQLFPTWTDVAVGTFGLPMFTTTGV